MLQSRETQTERDAMRGRIEVALLHRKINWDGAKSEWENYDLKLIEREKNNNGTIEQFMRGYLEESEFNMTQVKYLTPAKIDDWWKLYVKNPNNTVPEIGPDGGMYV